MADGQVCLTPPEHEHDWMVHVTDRPRADQLTEYAICNGCQSQRKAVYSLITEEIRHDDRIKKVPA